MSLSISELEDVSHIFDCDKSTIEELLDNSSLAVISVVEAKSRFGLDGKNFDSLMRFFRVRAEPLLAPQNSCLVAELPNGRLLVTTSQNWWRFLKYRTELAQIKKWKSDGATLISALSRLDNLLSDDPSTIKTMASVGWRSYFDLELVKLPYWGGLVELPPELGPALFRSAQVWQARNLDPCSFDAVVEVGCGVGSFIVSLAAVSGPASTRFIGTDFSRYALRCTAELGEIAHVSVETYELDVKSPRFDWLAGCRRILVLCSGVLCALDEPPNEFFDSFVRLGAFVKFLIFEPIGAQICAKGLKQGHVPPSASLAVNSERNDAIWDAIDGRSSRKEIRIDRLVPDFICRIPSFPLSLLELSCNHNTN